MEGFFSLADESMAALGSPKRGLLRKEKIISQTVKNSSALLYKKMKNAARFVIDDELLWYVAEQSVNISAPALRHCLKNVSRLPAPIVWFEWNERTRVRAINQTIFGDDWDGPMSHIPERVGYLAEEDMTLCHGDQSNSLKVETSYDGAIFTNFFRSDPNMEKQDSIGKQKICVGAAGFKLNFGEPFTRSNFAALMADYLYGDPTKKVEDDLLDGNIELSKSMSKLLLSDWWCDTEEKKNHQPEILDDIFGSIFSCQTQAIDWWCNTDIEFDMKEFQEVMAKSVNSTAGDARFMITLLATLNYDWVALEPETKFSSRRMRYGKPVTGNTYQVVKIKLPKQEDNIRLVHSSKELQNRMRLHKVRGHWCVRRATGKRYWRKAHSRGNKELGEIIKDYELVKS
jgi:hypothetical protein